MSRMNNDLFALVRCGAQFRGEETAAFGLKGCHIGYLTRICYQPGISQDQLAQMMFINKSNVARQVAVLEEEGFVIRSASAADKRVLELYPTEKTLALLPNLLEIVNRWDGILMEGLTEEEVQTVSRILGKMKENAAAWSSGR